MARRLVARARRRALIGVLARLCALGNVLARGTARMDGRRRMDLEFTKEELAFREEVRAFVKEKLPADIREKVDHGVPLAKNDAVRWQKILYEKGWAAPNWPVEYGGTGWTPTQIYIFDDELGAAGAPPVVPFGLKMVAPVIYTFGNEEQKKRFLPDILASNVWWCQGYSEPGSGSDLASLSTRAVRDGDHYIVNGIKAWTTLGQHADWIFCLVRTDPNAKKQQGISFLLIDMKTPGVSVHPVITMEGDHEVNETHFEDVRVPVENRIGPENRGWDCAKYLLTHERTNIAQIGVLKRGLRRLRRESAKIKAGDGVLLEQPSFARRVAELEVQLTAVEFTSLRILSTVQRGGAPGAESSLLKVRGTELQQAFS
ncbi:MAG TPA: acyl-CoA dehydrogenase family protein, partial [Polyangiaceae bacterium]|nr:acyl-CoA dehydrogenase family protein [Polyangiaceae bacterium]